MNLYGQVEENVDMAYEQILWNGNAHDDKELKNVLSNLAYEDIESTNQDNQRFLPNPYVVVKLNGVEQTEKEPWLHVTWEHTEAFAISIGDN